MTVTAETVRTYAPEFADDSNPTDERIDLFIAEAMRYVSSSAWSARYDDGVLFLTLHLMTMWYRAQPASGAAVGSGGTAAVGPIHWAQVDNQQLGFSSPSASAGAKSVKRDTDSWYEASAWGQKYTSLRRLVFAARALP
jgi:hypothetical protein